MCIFFVKMTGDTSSERKHRILSTIATLVLE